ncbi:hypothetical protein [Streptosporangium roseum]|uniref:hypothetical protein n=1 Tax=Streptosporangium roseum TaxID=2001 RepID=UPI0012DD34C6|nr:hypothetical protein [Streptosporangium roseum]
MADNDISEDRSETPLEEERRRYRWEIIIPAIAGVVGALIGSLTTYLVATVPIQDQHAKETRERRSAVYQELLDSAERYAFNTNGFLDGCKRVTGVGDSFTVICGKTYLLSDVDNARYDFQAAINKMHIYGSDEAVSAAKSLAQTLPPAVRHLDGPIVTTKVEAGEFERSYILFQDVMCKDLSNSSDRTCDEEF